MFWPNCVSGGRSVKTHLIGKSSSRFVGARNVNETSASFKICFFKGPASKTCMPVSYYNVTTTNTKLPQCCSNILLVSRLKAKITIKLLFIIHPC